MNTNPEIVVTAIADTNPERIEWAKKAIVEFREKYPESDIPDMAYFSDGSDLIKSGACEAILIAVPHYDHPRYAIEGLDNGLHVMCEKPAGVYTLDVRAMNEEAANKLLKILEEPWDKTVFILIAERADRLLKTILSRTQEITVPRLTIDELLPVALQSESDSLKAQNIARLACGDVIELRRLLGQSSDEAREENFATSAPLCASAITTSTLS
jgi:DNA polymerase III delta prime subunit